MLGGERLRNVYKASLSNAQHEATGSRRGARPLAPRWGGGEDRLDGGTEAEKKGKCWTMKLWKTGHVVESCHFVWLGVKDALTNANFRFLLLLLLLPLEVLLLFTATISVTK